MINTSFKKLLAAILLLFTATSLFAVEEYVSKIYKDIDVIFIEKSDEKLNDILQENREDKYYYLIENYAAKKIRRLIVVNDYAFAMDAIVVVIENNLDNEEAVEMYSIIAEAYETQLAYEEKLEQDRQREIARVQGEKEKQRGAVEKEYQSSRTAEGSSVYVTGKEVKSSNYLCDFTFGMANFSLLNDSSSKFMGTNFGLSVNLNYVFYSDSLLFGADAYGDVHFLAFGSEEYLPLLTNMDFAVKVGSKSISKNMFARVGIGALSTNKMKEQNITTGIVNQVFSPLIGVELDRVSVGPAKLNFSLDALLGTLWTPGVKFGGQGFFDLAIPYAQLEKINLNFHVGVKDIFLIKDAGMENRASVFFAIGAENVNF